MDSTPEPTPPASLSQEATNLWLAITTDWSMDAPSLAILSVAMESLDRMRQAQRDILHLDDDVDLAARMRAGAIQ